MCLNTSDFFLSVFAPLMELEETMLAILGKWVAHTLPLLKETIHLAISI